MTNGLAHYYQLGDLTVILGALEVIFKSCIPFLVKCQTNRIVPDGTPRSAASHLGLYCLPIAHKKVAMS